MAYLTESVVRAAARQRVRVAKRDTATILKESVETASAAEKYDVFLCHSIKDAEIVLGTKTIIEQKNLTVYVDWIVDPQMDRSAVSARTASVLRSRMRNSKCLFYLYSENSTRSRWMPWELGFFDGNKGAVAVIPVEIDGKDIDFTKEEYLGLYPKVEITASAIFVNRTSARPVTSSDTNNFMLFSRWVENPSGLQM